MQQEIYGSYTSKWNLLIAGIRKLCGYKFPKLGPYVSKLFFKLAPSAVQCELFPCIYVQLNLHDLTQQATYWQGARFEFPTPQILASWGKEKATAFFDIGANYGFYSYWMLHSCSDILVYAFEPNPKTHALLEMTKQANNLQRLTTFQIGLGEKPETLDLHPGIDDLGHSTFLPHPAFVHSTIGKISILSFDKWREQSGLALPQKPEWIAKIDVEGFEYKVLNGMKETLSAQAFKGVSVEILKHTLALCSDSPKDIFKIMEKFNYKPIKRNKRMKTVNIFFVPR